MSARTHQAGVEVASARLRKARQFFDAAETIREFAEHEADVGDAFVTLCVHAGIAAADALCIRALGEHARGESHAEAVQLLKRVRPDGAALGNTLNALLGMKTRAAYSAEPVNTEMRTRARRGADRLPTAARDRVP